MIRDGWRADPTDPGRLVHDNLRGNHTRVNMAEWEAVAFHIKMRPLYPRQKKIVSAAGPKEIRGTAPEGPAPTEKL